MSIPVDLRRYLPHLRTTAGVTAMLKIGVLKDDDWPDVDTRLLTALSELPFLADHSDPLVQTMPMPFVRDLRRWMDNLAKADTDLVRTRKLESSVAAVAHLGAVELADFCAGGFEATSCYRLGAVTYIPEIDVVENRERTEVTVAWRDGPGVAERIEALLDRIEEELSPRARRCSLQVLQGGQPFIDGPRCGRSVLCHHREMISRHIQHGETAGERPGSLPPAAFRRPADGFLRPD